MTTTAQQVSTTTATGSSDERRTLPWALIVALIALAALTIAVVTWQLTATTNTTAPATQSPRLQPTNGPLPARRLGLPAAGPQGRSRPTGPLPARRLGLPAASPQGRKLTAPAVGRLTRTYGWRRPTGRTTRCLTTSMDATAVGRSPQ